MCVCVCVCLRVCRQVRSGRSQRTCFSAVKCVRKLRVKVIILYSLTPPLNNLLSSFSTLARSLALSRTLSLARALSLCVACIHTCACKHVYSLSFSLSLALTHTHTLSLPPSLSLALSWSVGVSVCMSVYRSVSLPPMLALSFTHRTIIWRNHQAAIGRVEGTNSQKYSSYGQGCVHEIYLGTDFRGFLLPGVAARATPQVRSDGEV